VTLDAATPTQASLMGDATVLHQYDVLMLPCEGADYTKPAQELSNLVGFANAGGRVFTSHYSYSWMWNNPPFNTVAQWIGGPGTEVLFPNVLEGTVDTSFPEGETLAEWLPLVGATSTPGDIPVVTPFKDTNGVIAPTQEWLTVTYPLSLSPNPPMATSTAQFVFDTPVAPTGTTVNQCGRVLYNDYHVENPPSKVTASTIFPNECPYEGLTGMTPEEKLLEYNLFELTDDGGLPSIIPATYDFGSEAVGIPDTLKLFTWINNSSGPMAVSSVSITGSDFSIIAGTDTCSNMIIAGGASCTIAVGFTPSAIGARTGTLSVVSGGFSQTASLNGTGAPGFSLSPGSLSFGSVAVGDNSSQTVTLTSNASGPQPLPILQITNGFSVSTTGCANPVPALGTCVVTVTFSPTQLASQVGVQTGTLTAVVPLSDQRTLLSGTGIPDFTLTACNPELRQSGCGLPLHAANTHAAKLCKSRRGNARLRHRGQLLGEHSGLRRPDRSAFRLPGLGDLHPADDRAVCWNTRRQLDRPGLRGPERLPDRKRRRLYHRAQSRLRLRHCRRRSHDDRDVDTAGGICRATHAELYRNPGGDGIELQFFSDDGDADNSRERVGQHQHNLAVYGRWLQRVWRQAVPVADSAGEWMSSVEQASEDSAAAAWWRIASNAGGDWAFADGMYW